MMTSSYIPQHLRTRSFLPGHGRAARTHRRGDLPVNTNERRARRAVWMRGQSDRQEQSQRTGRIAFVGAALALLLTMTMAMATPKAASQALSARTPATVETHEAPASQLADVPVPVSVSRS